jgi:hypothetical protein
VDNAWLAEDYFRINLPMNFYWSVLCALDAGLGIMDVTDSVFDYQYDPEKENGDEARGLHLNELYTNKVKRTKALIPIFKFFNDYAGQVYPEDADKAFIAFRKGIVVNQDVAKKIGNLELEAEDLLDFAKHMPYGAKVDDPTVVHKGQMYQRQNQTKFNDLGQNIPEGNFKRFITQIEPDEHDQPYWRIGDDEIGEIGPYDNQPNKRAAKEGRFGRGVDAGQKSIYLDVDDAFTIDNTEKMEVTVTYFDGYIGEVSEFKVIVHQKNNSPHIITVNTTGQEEWKTTTLEIESNLRNSVDDNKRKDIVLRHVSGNRTIFHMVQVHKQPKN